MKCQIFVHGIRKYIIYMRLPMKYEMSFCLFFCCNLNASWDMTQYELMQFERSRWQQLLLYFLKLLPQNGGSSLRMSYIVQIYNTFDEVHNQQGKYFKFKVVDSPLPWFTERRLSLARRKPGISTAICHATRVSYFRRYRGMIYQKRPPTHSALSLYIQDSLMGFRKCFLTYPFQIHKCCLYKIFHNLQISTYIQLTDSFLAHRRYSMHLMMILSHSMI